MDADDLYRLPPEDFTAARDAAAKERRAVGDKEAAAELKALRRPSVAAWLVNTLAHEDADVLEQLLALGPELAQAQAQGRGDELRRLGAQRRQLVAAVTDRAVEVGDREVTAAVREEVQGTFEAALADPPSAEAVRSGRLVRSLSYAGFGGVDLDGAVAVTGGPARTPAKEPTKEPAKAKGPADAKEPAKARGPAKAKGPAKGAPEQQDDRAERIAAAEAAALDAAGALDDAVRTCEQGERERRDAEQAAEQAHRELERLQEAVRQAEEAARQAEEAARQAEEAARQGEAAAQEADAARRAAEQDSERAVGLVQRRQAAEQEARAALDRLRRGGT